MPARPSLAIRGGLDLLVAGHVNLDRFLWTRELPAPDRTVPIHRAETVLGGTATNLARSAASFGVRTGLVARVGDDFPPAFRRTLTAERIDLRGLEIVARSRTPACYIAQDGRARQMTLIDQGAMADARRARVPEAVIRLSRWLHVGTGDPAYLLRLQSAARSMRVPVSVDPAQEIHFRWKRGELRQLLEGAEIFFANEQELSKALQLLGLASVERMLELVPLVVVTRGPRGATALSRAARSSVPGVRTRRIVSLVGAGDAFRGGFFAGWIDGRPLRECLVAGVRSASKWIEGRGPKRLALVNV